MNRLASAGRTRTFARSFFAIAVTRSSWFLVAMARSAGPFISFFALEGSISLALALLIAGVGGAIVAMAVAATRILQLRRMVRRGR